MIARKTTICYTETYRLDRSSDLQKERHRNIMTLSSMCAAALKLFLCAVMSLTTPAVTSAAQLAVREGYVEQAEASEQSQQGEDGAEVFTMKYILHAGGVTPQGVKGSNSLEALNRSYEQGYRVMEVDFCWTLDGEPVCVHDWKNYYTFVEGDMPTLAEFEALRAVTYGFTSMTPEHLAQWLEGHPDARIVTDFKENNLEGAALIAQRYPHLLDQFVIQIYHPEEYEPVVQMGFSHVILTVYQMTWEEKSDAAALTAFLAGHPVMGLTFSTELLEQPGYLDALLETGIPLYVHTVNDREEQQVIFDLGVSGVYTDFGAAPDPDGGTV